jgi:DNA-binding Xre family transcriptional regulator
MNRIDKSVVTKREYGRVSLKLRPIMDERGITRNALARSVSTRFEVIDKWYNGRVEKLDLDVLARICFVLNCEVQDLIVYETKLPDAEQD